MINCPRFSLSKIPIAFQRSINVQRGNIFLKKYSCMSTFSSLSENAVMFSWGDGTSGQLGHARFDTKLTLIGSAYIQEEPRKLVKSKRLSQIAVGEECSIGITHMGEILGWGKSDLIGVRESICKEPTILPFFSSLKFLQVSFGHKHAAAVDIDGKVLTWGKDGSWMRGGGLLGHGDRTDVKAPKVVSFFDDYGAKIKSVACGSLHTLFLTTDGEVLGCGTGEYGRTGTGNTGDTLIPQPLEALSKEEIVQISAGFDHSIALTRQGQLYTWGRNNSGQLGHGDSFIDIYSMEDFPRLIEFDSENDDAVSGDLAFVNVSAGHSRCAAVSSDGRVFIWGARLSHTPKPLDISQLGGQRVLKAVCGGDASHSVIAILTEDGSLWTLGDAAAGLLGRTGASTSPIPTRVASLKGLKVLDIYGGFGRHMFAKVEAPDSV